jgi:lipopolysaccharide transport system ATP-binding protein
LTSTAIRIRNLSKRYRIGARERGYSTLRDTISRAVAAPWRRFRELSGTTAGDDTFWALKDVSFDVRPGELVGIIGRNGAGKSTLLKILSQITEPTEGEVELHGRVGSLLEVGTGFHPELTGRENIYLNGAILGMRRSEIARRFDAIVAFAEVERFLDTPVKRYSSGMATRLGFSVAAHLEPDVLIVDEVLAVGDVAFQEKCIGKMNEAGRSGRTVLFVSHNMAALESLCTRGVVIQSGRVVFDGTQVDAIRHYYQQNAASRDGRYRRDEELGPAGSSQVRITRARMTAGGDECGGQFAIGVPLEFEVECTCRENALPPGVGIGIQNEKGQRIVTLHTRCDPRLQMAGHSSTRFRYTCRVDQLALVPGDYHVYLAIAVDGQVTDFVENALAFTVLPTDFFGNGGKGIRGVIYTPQRWQLESE